MVNFFCLRVLTVWMIVSNFRFVMLILLYQLISSFDVEPNPGPRPSDSLTLQHVNIRSIKSGQKLIDLHADTLNNNSAIVAVTETWLDNTIDSSEIELPGFQVIRKDRNRNGGGIALYIRKDLAFKHCPELEPDAQSLFEGLWIRLFTPQGSLLLGTFYCPPSMPANVADDYITYLETTINTVTARNYQSLILTGDFNAKSKNWYSLQENNQLGTRLYDFVNRNGMMQLVTEPTRITENSRSLIDLIITNSPQIVTDTFVNPPLLRCDHLVIGASLCLSVPSGSYTKTFYNLNRTDIGSLQNALISHDWESCLDRNNAEDSVHKWVDSFTNIINNNTHISKITIRNRDKPWFKNSLNHIIHVRHRMFRRARTRNTIEAWDSFKRADEECGKALAKARQDYYQSLVDDLSDYSLASKKWWSATKDLTGKRKSTSIPNLLDESNKQVLDDRSKCNLLNRFFAKQSSLDDSGVSVPPVTPYTGSILNAMSFTVNEVLKVINSLNISKATGPDGIGNSFIRQVLPPFAGEITIFFNFCLQNGIFPNQWKMSFVTPVFKKGDRTHVNNYRPISLLCCLSKVFERLVANHIMKYIISNNLVSQRQSGFMPNDSTTNQILHITNDILESFEKGDETIVVFMDISKAFDRVWHRGLLVKLENNGIKGSLLKWFQSYLSDRYQRVVLNGVQSFSLPVHAGVPQGSILGPILFLLYINDITHEQICTDNLFADDASVMESNRDIQRSIDKISLELARIECWAIKWLVTFNINKTVYMVFSNKPTPTVVPPFYFCGGYLKLVESHTHLGMLFSQNLDWNLHINSILAKSYQRLNMLRMLSKLVPRQTLIILYFSMIRSILDYGCHVYCSLSAADAKRLEQLQYKAGLIITGGIQGTSYCEVLSELGWCTVANRRLYFQASLMYKIVNGTSPIYLQNMILGLPTRTVNVTLRNADHLLIPRYRLSGTGKGFRVSSIRLWNSLPRSLRLRTSIHSFKDNYKKEYFPPVRRDFNSPLNSKFSFLLYRFRLGFTTLNDDLGRRGMIDSRLCACQTSHETYSHFLLECPMFVQSRQHLLDGLDLLLDGIILRRPGLSKRALTNILLTGIGPNNPKNIQIFKLVLTYLLETGRFH